MVDQMLDQLIKENAVCTLLFTGTIPPYMAFGFGVAGAENEIQFTLNLDFDIDAHTDDIAATRRSIMEFIARLQTLHDELGDETSAALAQGSR